jgi:hypothetical protein
MKTRSFTFAASALALGLATLAGPRPVQAQPLWDRVDVNLPYSVTISDKTLQPGNYVIQQLDSPTGGSQVLLIYGDNGMKFETSALTIPALENRTQPDTRVILHHIGGDYFFDKVWIQGKNYGYEFPLPNSVKMREKEAMQPVSVAANASSVPATQTTTTQSTATAATNQSTVQQTTTQQATTQQATTQQATTQQATTQQATTQQATTQQATTQQATNPPVTTQQQTSAAQATMPPATMPDTANRSSEAPAMPHTSAGWLMMLLSGGALSGLGAKLRAKRQ